MKKALLAILALALLLSLAISALADADVRVTKETVKVYEDRDTDSEVIKKIKKGKTVLIDVDYGSWVGILVEADEGQTIGWVRSKYLRCKHEWSDWEVVRKATCSRAGLRRRYCLRCGEEETKEIPKLEHKFGKWIVEREATCAKPGLEYRVCKVCGYEEDKEYTVPHTFGDWEVTKQPTCTQTGMRERECEVCGYVESKAMDKLPHDFEYRIIEEATDHSSGTRARVCRVCGYTEDAVSYDPEGTLRRKDRGDDVRQLQQLLADQGYLNAGGADGVYGGGTEKAVMQFQKDQGLNPDGIAWPQTRKRLNHDFGPWETIRPLTRSTPGLRQRVCKDCGYVQQETIEVGDVIERGSRGEQVRALQQMLKKIGYDAGGTDGIYGKKLDAAFQAFSNAQGLDFEPGKVRPADVDALVNAWIASDAGGMKEGTTDSAVNLALTVTPTADENADGNATTYTWMLTNLGTRPCMFNALLLAYGRNPDFKQGDLVMKLDGYELKANCLNSASGSFTVAKDWGDGNLNFAAMAVDEKTGTKWLSNAVVFESAAAGEPKTVAPQSASLNVNALPEGTYPVSFDPGDIAKVTSGIYMNAVHFYTMDTYDAEAIQSLRAGDTVMVGGEAYPVSTVSVEDDWVTVNDALDYECHFAPLDDGSAWRAWMDDDDATYTDRGLTTLLVDPSAIFVDNSDLDKGEVVTEYDGLLAAIQAAGDVFDPYTTTVKIENGRVAELDLNFHP